MALDTKQVPRQSSRPALARTRQRGRFSSSLPFYLFVSPWILGFLVLTVGPLGYALLVSFSNYDGISDVWRWVGIGNYVEALHDPLVWYSLSRTLLYAAITVPASIIGGLGIAVLLNQRFRGVGVFRAIFYLPAVLPIVATAIMIQFIFDRDTGAINALLEVFHGAPLTWLLDPTAFFVLIIWSLWGLGNSMIVFLAGLQGIPLELLEAASIDGASRFRAFRSVTLPLLSPIMFFQVVTGSIASLQIFIQPILLSPSGNVIGTTLPNIGSVQHGNYLYMVNVYAQFFSFQRFGYGSALLWILFLVVLAITLLVFRSSSLWVFYEVDQRKK